MSIELKVKYKHLSLEPSVMKHEIRKLKRQYRWLKDNKKSASHIVTQIHNLINYHKTITSPAARSTHLARAFIKGIPYKLVEQNTHENDMSPYHNFPYSINARAIFLMVQKYHNPQTRYEDITDWLCANNSTV